MVIPPSLGVLLSMILPATRGTMIGQAAYAISKAWILVVPLIWIALVEKGRWSRSPMQRGGLGFGALLGLLISAVIWGAYLLFGDRIIDADQLRTAIIANGIDTKWKYIALCTYLSLVNALLEEYVWRWFVFRRCEVLLRSGLAAVIFSGLFFTLHHVFALKAQLGWAVTILGSLGVFIGGVTWSGLYLKYRSIWPGYLSHVIVDIAIFVIGYHIIFGG